MAAGDLTTVAKVREFLGLDASSADDKIQGYVTSSSRAVVGMLGREWPLTAGDYTEVHSGDGGQSLTLKRFPVNTVTSVTVDGSAVPARATVTDTGFVLDGTTIQLVGYYFTKGTSNVSIVYNAGHSAIPENLELAVRRHAAMEYRAADRQGLASSSIAGESTSYDPGREWASLQTLLDPFREYRES